MLRPSLLVWSRLVVANAILLSGCLEDLGLEPPPPQPGEDGAPVEAQFDPTNPIPVLQRIPTPTVFAQNPDGTLNQAAVQPEACELPTSAQCLAFVDGWPTTTPITLFFSGQVDLATLAEGIELYEVGATGAFTRVPIDTANAVQSERPAPGPDLSAAPMADPNACSTEFGYSSEVLIGYDLNLRPAEPLKLATQYILLVKSDSQGGLRDTDGRPIQPSALFYLLNDDEVPVQEDGEITSALLRSQVQGTLLATAFGGKLLEELTPAERMSLDEQTRVLGADLRLLYVGFEGIVQASSANGVVNDRTELVFANAWTTGGPPRPTPVFDPNPMAPQVPFPNSELLITTTADGDRRLNIPDSPTSPIPSEALVGLNKLDGFSLRTPAVGPLPETGPVMLFSTEAPVDVATLADSVVMYPLDDQGLPLDPLALEVVPSSTTGPRSSFGPSPRFNPPRAMWWA